MFDFYILFYISGGRSRFFQWFCTGGIPSPSEKVKNADEKEHLHITTVSRFCKEKYAPFILKLPVKIIIILSYFIYLAFGIWGCTMFTDGISYKELLPPSSHFHQYANQNERFEKSYGPVVMFAINETIDYSNKDIQNEVVISVENARKLEYFLDAPEMTTSWLHQFIMYLDQTDQNPQNMSHFIQILNLEFLTLPENAIFERDIVFNTEKTEIQHSRFLLQSFGVEQNSIGSGFPAPGQNRVRQPGWYRGHYWSRILCQQALE